MDFATFVPKKDCQLELHGLGSIVCRTAHFKIIPLNACQSNQIHILRKNDSIHFLFMLKCCGDAMVFFYIGNSMLQCFTLEEHE